MSRPSWHRQAGLEAAVNAVRPDLDHEVRVDMMLGIALVLPGHHIPPILRLGGLAARRTSSSAHRSSMSHKCAQRVHASAPAIEAPRVEKGIVAWPSHAAMPLYISGRAAVASRPGIAALIVRSGGIVDFRLTKRYNLRRFVPLSLAPHLLVPLNMLRLNARGYVYVRRVRL